jgi:hypothetical protein
MSDAVTVGLIAAVPATLVGIAALVTALRANRKTDNLAVSVDGRLSALLATTGAEQRLVGHGEGVEAERARIEQA